MDEHRDTELDGLLEPLRHEVPDDLQQALFAAARQVVHDAAQERVPVRWRQRVVSALMLAAGIAIGALGMEFKQRNPGILGQEDVASEGSFSADSDDGFEDSATIRYISAN